MTGVKPQRPPKSPRASRKNPPKPPPVFSPSDPLWVEKKPEPPTPPQKTENIQVKTGLLGKILVDNGLLSIDQRDECIRTVSEPGNTMRFGEIAVSKGFITDQNLKKVLDAQKQYVSGVKLETSLTMKMPEEVAKLSVSKKADPAQLLKWLMSGLKHGASDLHVMVDQPLILRHMGRMVKSRGKALDKSTVEEALLSILSDEEKGLLTREQSIVKCFDLPSNGRARANIFLHSTGLNGVFRLIPPRAPSLVSLNLPSSLAKFTTYSQGLVLITGPIGSGKTTTMAALLDIINQERYNHIITIENPVEFIHTSNVSLVTQRQVGDHTKSYANALRAALREDPDVIAVGEMNDLETARLTISAAETGHLVFATLHTENAVRSINRVLDIFPSEEQGQVRTILSENLRGVISQQLVPRLDSAGRMPVVEIMFSTPAIRNLIRDKKVHQIKNLLKMSRNVGNRSAFDHAEEMLEAGHISKETCESVARLES